MWVDGKFHYLMRRMLELTESEGVTRRQVLGGAAVVAATVATFGSPALAISTSFELLHLLLSFPFNSCLLY